MPHTWFDAHLDLAYLAETGRDLHAEVDDCRGRHQPASITLPELRAARVHACLGTIFTEAVADPHAPDAETGAFAYPAGDAPAAWRAGMRQLKLYHAWRDAGLIALIPRRGSPWPDTTAPLRLGILMEGADPIESPEQLHEWADAGVIAIGMAWWRPSRYAAGNGVAPDAPSPALTDLGRALVPAIDDLNLVHDLSHLSQPATDELLALTSAPVIASHSNARALFPHQDPVEAQRHLADETIREIARRHGMIGINLYSRFLSPAAQPPIRATLDDVIAHIEHIAETAGTRACIGLGSDADGGFPASKLPQGINRARDFDTLADALRARGWSDHDLAGFTHANWRRFWRGD